jgi:hypothetical protein
MTEASNDVPGSMFRVRVQCSRSTFKVPGAAFNVRRCCPETSNLEPRTENPNPNTNPEHGTRNLEP